MTEKPVIASAMAINAVVLGPGNVEVQLIQQDVPLLIWRTVRGDFRKKAPTPRP